MYFLVVFERLFYNVSKFLFLFQRFFYKLIYFLISLRNLNNWQIFFWNRVLTLESSCFSFSFLSSNSFSSLLSNLSSFSSIFLSSSFLAPKQKWYIHFPQQVYYLLHLLSLQVIRMAQFNASVISNTFANPYHACCSLIKTKALYFLSLLM